MRAILIDPFGCTVTDVDFAAGEDLRPYYALLSHESQPVDHFEMIKLDGDGLFVDGYGAVKQCARFFWIGNYHTPLAGKGLILGADDDGEPAPATLDTGAVKKVTRFMQATAFCTLVPARKLWSRGDPMIVFRS